MEKSDGQIRPFFKRLLYSKMLVRVIPGKVRKLRSKPSKNLSELRIVLFFLLAVGELVFLSEMGLKETAKLQKLLWDNETIICPDLFTHYI